MRRGGPLVNAPAARRGGSPSTSGPGARDARGPRPRLGVLVGTLLAAGLGVSACVSPPAPDPLPIPSQPRPATSSPAPGGLDVIATGLQAPWSIAFHRGSALISERDTARILELTGDTTREVGVVDGVAHGGEGGLLGLAVHDSHLYAYLTTAGGNRVVRIELTGSPGSLGLGAVTPILDGLPAARHHNGGRIAFGPDGMLYVTVGDAGLPHVAQDLDALAGKILRLTPSGTVPADNPFDGSPVYSLGHRNPQGIAWDATGTMYASEFGQDTWDELNVIEPGGNYGWPEVEGIGGADDVIDPVQQWAPDAASPSGIAIAAGMLAVANLRGERLRLVPLADLSASSEALVGEFGRLRDVVVGPDGSFWVLTNNTDGRGRPADGDDRILRIPAG